MVTFYKETIKFHEPLSIGITWGGANAPPIFLLPNNSFFGAEKGQIRNINIF